jgi:hypothetical protein
MRMPEESQLHVSQVPPPDAVLQDYSDAIFASSGSITGMSSLTG